MEHTHMIICQKNPNSIINRVLYFGEEAARKDGNRLFKEGFYKIELYSRARVGWNLIKSVKQHELVAKAKQEAFAKSLSEKAQRYHDDLFNT